MGRVYDIIEVDGKKLNILFDPGALRSYIAKTHFMMPDLKQRH
jgi:hypothetical protein